MKITTLEKAKQRQQEPAPCKDCPKSERVNNALYCTVNGKMILPQFEDLCLCHGKLSGDNVLYGGPREGGKRYAEKLLAERNNK